MDSVSRKDHSSPPSYVSYGPALPPSGADRLLENGHSNNVRKGNSKVDGLTSRTYDSAGEIRTNNTHKESKNGEVVTETYRTYNTVTSSSATSLPQRQKGPHGLPPSMSQIPPQPTMSTAGSVAAGAYVAAGGPGVPAIIPPVPVASPPLLVPTTRVTRSHVRSARSSAEVSLERFMAVQLQYKQLLSYSSGTATVSSSSTAAAVQEQLRIQSGIALADLRALRQAVAGMARRAENRRMRRWILGSLLAVFIPLVRRLFRRPGVFEHLSHKIESGAGAVAGGTLGVLGAAVASNRYSNSSSNINRLDASQYQHSHDHYQAQPYDERRYDDQEYSDTRFSRKEYGLAPVGFKRRGDRHEDKEYREVRYLSKEDDALAYGDHNYEIVNVIRANDQYRLKPYSAELYSAVPFSEEEESEHRDKFRERRRFDWDGGRHGDRHDDGHGDRIIKTEYVRKESRVEPGRDRFDDRFDDDRYRETRVSRRQAGVDPYRDDRFDGVRVDGGRFDDNRAEGTRYSETRYTSKKHGADERVDDRYDNRYDNRDEYRDNQFVRDKYSVKTYQHDDQNLDNKTVRFADRTDGNGGNRYTDSRYQAVTTTNNYNENTAVNNYKENNTAVGAIGTAGATGAYANTVTGTTAGAGTGTGGIVASNDTEYAFARSRALLDRIVASIKGRKGHWATMALFLFGVLYIFTNEVTLRVARTLGRRLKRLSNKIQLGNEPLNESDLHLLAGWRWRVLLWGRK